MEAARNRIDTMACAKVYPLYVQEPLMRTIRILDKLVDELAKGKSMEKILR